VNSRLRASILNPAAFTNFFSTFVSPANATLEFICHCEPKRGIFVYKWTVSVFPVVWPKAPTVGATGLASE